VEACRRRRTGKERLCVHPGEPGRNGSRRSRFCPDFARLGLLRPSPAAERLVTAAVGGLQTTDRPGPLIAELRALPAELTEAQASQALAAVLDRIGWTTDPYQLQALARALQALAAKLTEAQASLALDPVLEQIGRTTDPGVLEALAQALHALPAKLSEAQASQALDSMLERIDRTDDSLEREALAHAFQALAAKLNEAEASQALDPMLERIGQTGNPETLLALAEALQALPAKLSETQASQALDPVLKRIGQVPNFYSVEAQARVLQAQAQVLQALAAKLTDAQAAQASKAAAASLAWAADDEEAAEWARALVALSRPAANRDGMLATTIAYPAAAGSATEVLLDAIRAGHSDASAKEAGSEPALAWLAKTFPGRAAGGVGMSKLMGVEQLFEGRHFDREVIILCVRWYLRFKLSLRDLVEMMAERGLSLAHTTIMRWVWRYAVNCCFARSLRISIVRGRRHPPRESRGKQRRWRLLRSAISKVLRSFRRFW
jgi:hypothetical protein